MPWSSSSCGRVVQLLFVLQLVTLLQYPSPSSCGFIDLYGSTLGPLESHGFYFSAYTPQQAPLPSFNRGEAYVRYSFQVNLKERRQQGSTTPTGGNNVTKATRLCEVLIYHGSIRDKIGSDYSRWTGERNYCCTASLFEAGGCSRIGEMNFNVSADPEVNGNLLYYKSLTLGQFHNQQSNITDYHKIQHTGIWYLAIANCASPPPAGRGGVSNVIVDITGQIEFKNPFGYLGGESFGYLFVFWIFSVLYIILALLWGVFSYFYGKNLMTMQHILAFVVGVSVVETLIWGGDYTMYNMNGVVHPVANIFGALFSSTKLTAIRLFVLLVVLGYKITTPTLKQRYKMGIIVIMISYFVMETSRGYIDVAEKSGEEIQNGLKGTMIFFLGSTEAIILLWIVLEVRRSLKDPNLLLHPAKQSMYLNMVHMLSIVVSVSVVVAVIDIVFQCLSNSFGLWKYTWVFGTYWESVYFVMILFMVWWWRPAPNNTRYAYAGLPGEGYGEEGEREDDGSMVVMEEEETAPKRGRRRGEDGDTKQVKLQINVQEEVGGGGGGEGGITEENNDGKKSNNMEEGQQ